MVVISRVAVSCQCTEVLCGLAHLLWLSPGCTPGRLASTYEGRGAGDTLTALAGRRGPGMAGGESAGAAALSRPKGMWEDGWGLHAPACSFATLGEGLCRCTCVKSPAGGTRCHLLGANHRRTWWPLECGQGRESLRSPPGGGWPCVNLVDLAWRRPSCLWLLEFKEGGFAVWAAARHLLGDNRKSSCLLVDGVQPRA